MLSVNGSDGSFNATTSMYQILDIILDATLSAEAKGNLVKLSGVNRKCFGRMLTKLLRGDVRKVTEIEEMFKDLNDESAPRYGVENKPARARNRRRF